MTDAPQAATLPTAPQDSGRLLLLLMGSLIGVFFLYQAGGGALTWFVIGDLQVTSENAGMFRVVTMVSQLMFILAPTLILAKWSGIGWKQIFPMRAPRPLEAGLAVLGLFALQRVLESLLFFQSLIPLPEFLSSVLEPIKEMVKSMMMTLVRSESPSEFFMVLLVVAIVPSITEEAFFRGLLQSLFDQISRPIWGVIGSGVIFGLFHVNPFDAIGLVGLGVFMAYTRYRSVSILVPVLLHFLNNGLAALAVTAGMQDEKLFAETIGQEPTLLFALGQGALFSALFVVIVRAYHTITVPLHQVRRESEEGLDT